MFALTYFWILISLVPYSCRFSFLLVFFLLIVSRPSPGLKRVIPATDFCFTLSKCTVPKTFLLFYCPPVMLCEFARLFRVLLDGLFRSASTNLADSRFRIFKFLGLLRFCSFSASCLLSRLYLLILSAPSLVLFPLPSHLYLEFFCGAMVFFCPPFSCSLYSGLAAAYTDPISSLCSSFPPACSPCHFFFRCSLLFFPDFFGIVHLGVRDGKHSSIFLVTSTARPHRPYVSYMRHFSIYKTQ